MMRLMIRTSLAGAALFAGSLLAHAQSLPPPEPPAEAAPIPNDEGYEVPAMPNPPAVPAPDSDADED
jgi:hypothetical protein